MESSENNILYGMILDQKHIGNIKIGPINWNHMAADVGYFIGSRDAWGKGLATEAVRRVTEFAFEELKLNKCNAGVYSGNPGSIRVLEKAGYILRVVREVSAWALMVGKIISYMVVLGRNLVDIR